MFQSHELVYTHNPKTGQYIGGGYTLNSELLTGGAPPLISLSGGRKNRRKRSGSGSGSGSGSESNDDNSNSNPNISSILSGNSSSIVIPAGLFLIHGTNRKDDDANDTASAFDLRPFLYNSDNDDNSNSGSSSDDAETDGDARKKKVRHNNVISDDIYTALFKMLSPNDSDKKRYWVGSAVTRKRRRQQQKLHPTPAITRKQKKK